MEVKTNVQTPFYLCCVPKEAEEAQFFSRPQQEIVPGNGVVILRDGGKFVLIRSSGGVEGWVPRRCLVKPFEVSCPHQRRDGLKSSRLKKSPSEKAEEEDGPSVENGERLVILDADGEYIKVRVRRLQHEGWIHRKHIDKAPPLSWVPRGTHMKIEFLTHTPSAIVKRKTLVRGYIDVMLAEQEEVQVLCDGGSELLILTNGGVQGWANRTDLIEPFIVHAVHHRRDGVTATRLRKDATQNGEFVTSEHPMVENGETVRVLEINGDFLKVQCVDTVGWLQRVHMECVPLSAMTARELTPTPSRCRTQISDDSVNSGVGGLRSDEDSASTTAS